MEIDYFQSNIEGEMIDCIQQVGFDVDGIILNAGAYTHTSIAVSYTHLHFSKENHVVIVFV